MPSQSETGHAKNVANFKDLIIHVKSLGSVYSPSKAGLQLVSLETKHLNAAGAMPMSLS